MLGRVVIESATRVVAESVTSARDIMLRIQCRSSSLSHCHTVTVTGVVVNTST